MNENQTNLIFIDLYQTMTEGIASLIIGVILPLLAGLALTAAFSARLVNHLFERDHSVVSHIILGVVIASTLLIVPTQFTGITDAALAWYALRLGLAWRCGWIGWGRVQRGKGSSLYGSKDL